MNGDGFSSMLAAALRRLLARREKEHVERRGRAVPRYTVVEDEDGELRLHKGEVH